MDGRYTLFKVTKKNLTTYRAVDIISEKFGVNDIGYAGLKDKFAITTQFMTSAGDIKDFAIEGLDVKVIGKINCPISTGDLTGNDFLITLHDCKNISKAERIAKDIKKNGIPNYFGPQRFGINLDNHIKGKQIVKGELLVRDKKKAKLYIHAYQAWMFNKILSTKKNKGRIEIPGYKTKLNSMMKEEGIRPEQFRVDKLRITCNGATRMAFIYPDISFEKQDKNLRLSFRLPKGSYATIVIMKFQNIKSQKQICVRL